MSGQAKHCDEIVRRLQSDVTHGLTNSEAAARLVKNGPNKLTEKKGKPLLVRFFMQLNDFMIIILLAAAGISFAVSLMSGENDFADPIIILLIVSLNAILGLAQESKAEKALEALKRMSAPSAAVIRSGRLMHTDAQNIVTGDIIVLEAGGFVPADARLITSVNLKAEESALTGESVPVEKDAEHMASDNAPTGDRLNMVFAGSSISYGRGTAIVTATGMQTEMGKIAEMLMDGDAPETPLQKKLGETGKSLGLGALAICTVIFVIGVLRQIPPLEMFMTSVSLAVAAIPEGLPAIVTIMLAVGVSKMAARNAVIRKLPAVETLGSATVICSDKTGTLTQNKMEVTEVSDGFSVVTGKKSTHIIKLAALCSDCVVQPDSEAEGGQLVIGDPTEAALVTAALRLGMHKNGLEKEYPRAAEVPFDSKRKLMTTIHRNGGLGYCIVTKGAPDVLLARCTHYYINGEAEPLTERKRREILAKNSEMADKALRVLAVAFSIASLIPNKPSSENVEANLTFAGLVGMIDPPRDEARGAVAVCHEAGIRPVMITGDHASTACAIAKKVGIMRAGGHALTGAELSALSDAELEDAVERYSVFARVSPEHKVRIVKAFQARGNVVAMTGDGVNDAPALKAADIGCAMGISGTDVAKGAADMVLTDDNFATVVEAVREGRGIYANIKKAVHFLLSSNIGEIITIFVAILLGWDTPLLAVQLLWVNLVTDSLPAIALGVDPPEEGIMRRKPVNSKGGLFTGGLWQQIGFEGCMIGMLSLLGFGIGTIYFDEPNSHIIGRTMAFATLSISQLVHAFNMRSDESIFRISVFSNKYLVGAFFAGLALQVSVIMIPFLAKVFKVTPLSPYCWLIVTFLSLMPVVIVELEKQFSVAKGRKEGYNRVYD